MKLIVISGRSGSGKSTVLRTLEDAGYLCVDNLPVNLLDALVREQMAVDQAQGRIGVCIDARSGSLTAFPDILLKIRELGVELQILYLDALGPTLVKRFSETRRRHPLTSASVDLHQAIDIEARLLASLADMADLTLDTTQITGKELREAILERVLEHEEKSISLLFRSFGFKHGVPVDADYVFDLRCLPNPHWVEGLRSLTGLDADVASYLEQQPMVEEMFSEITQALGNWLPRFVKSDRMYMTVCVGCTGGQHRSVFFAEKLGRRFSQTFDHVLVRHRELERLKISQPRA